MTKRDVRVDARPWLVVQASDGRAEVEYDRGQPGLVILQGGQYWQESDARTHRDSYNRAREVGETARAGSQESLFPEGRAS